MADPSDKPATKRGQRPPSQSQDSGGGSLIHQQTEISYSGPLPPPGVLEGFERVLPGAADRIFAMAEKQLDHRISIEKASIESGVKNSAAGIKAAVAIEAMLVAGSCYLAHMGLGADAIKVMGGSIVMLAGAFGLGTWSRRTERVKKQRIISQQDTDVPASLDEKKPTK